MTNALKEANISSTKRMVFFVLFLLIYAFMILYSGGALNIPDRDSYGVYYNDRKITGDFGYDFLQGLFIYAGLSFESYCLFCAIIGLIIVAIFAGRILDEKGLVLFALLYLIYPFILDAMQIRNFLASAFFSFAFYFLTKESFKEHLLFIPFMLLSISMHKVLIVYVPFILFVNIDRKKWLQILLIIVVGICMIVGSNRSSLNYFVEIVRKIVTIVIGGKYSYLNIKTHYGWMLFWALSLMNVALTMYVRKRAVYCSRLDYQSKRFYSLTFWLNVYTLIALPLYVCDPNFFRFARNLQIINLVSYVGFIRSSNLKKIYLEKREYVLFCLGMLFSIACCFYVTIYRENLTQYFLVALRDNWIW